MPTKSKYKSESKKSFDRRKGLKGSKRSEENKKAKKRYG